MAEQICPLCERPLAEPMNRHHLIPLSKGGKGTETVMMHKICQGKVHAVFTERELSLHYNTVDALKGHDEIAKFIKWIKKKPPEFYDGSMKMKK
ncbi:MAG: HNH endonuclease [Bacteroidetes bacterium]|nr:HNH endonuclease [Bacteroidota bacterium]